MRKRARTDRNQPEIVAALRKCGASVLVLSSVGHGCPDLLVARSGKMCLMEIKDGEQSPSRRELTPDEAEFHLRWKAPVKVVCNIREALAAINLVR